SGAKVWAREKASTIAPTTRCAARSGTAAYAWDALRHVREVGESLHGFVDALQPHRLALANARRRGNLEIETEVPVLLEPGGGDTRRGDDLELRLVGVEQQHEPRVRADRRGHLVDDHRGDLCRRQGVRER